LPRFMGGALVDTPGPIEFEIGIKRDVILRNCFIKSQLSSFPLCYVIIGVSGGSVEVRISKVAEPVIDAYYGAVIPLNFQASPGDIVLVGIVTNVANDPVQFIVDYEFVEPKMAPAVPTVSPRVPAPAPEPTEMITFQGSPPGEWIGTPKKDW